MQEARRYCCEVVGGICHSNTGVAKHGTRDPRLKSIPYQRRRGYEWNLTLTTICLATLGCVRDTPRRVDAGNEL